ncbi:MAG TPA: hypothetical protein VGM69_08980 [Chloroflexota bacterium]|jgi:predicted DNA-binding protein
MTPTRLFRRRKHSRLRGVSAGRPPILHGVRHGLGAFGTYPFTVGSDLRQVAGDTRRPLTFSAQDADAIEAEVYSHLAPVKRRIWLQRALLLLVRAAVLVVGLVLAASLLSLIKLPLQQEVVEIGAGVVGLWALLLIVRQRVTYAEAARVLDRRLDLGQTLGTAVELIHAGADGRLARLQLRRATDAVRRVESARAVPFRLPMRDLRTVAALGVLALVFSYLATLNIAWPGSAPPADQLASDPGLELVDQAPTSPSVYEGDPTGMFDPSLIDSSLDSYLTDLEGQNLSPEEMQQRIAEIQAQLAQRAEAANRQREALNGLADALSDSSATSDAAESIRRGDYQKAASQLSDLGKQSGQLSQRARADLAKRLNDAAQKVSANSSDLANRMRKTAQALSQNDQGATEQSMNELGEGVNQAGEQLKALSDTSGPYDPSQMGDTQGYDPTAAMSDLQNEALNGLSNYEGGTPPDEFSQGMGEGEGEGFGATPSDAQSPGAASQRSDAVGGQDSTGSGGAGAGPGRDQYQAPDPNRPQTQGKLLELRGRPSEGGSSRLDDGDKVPLVNSSDGSVGAAVGTAARQAIVDPLSVRSEQNFVPWEKRQIIKDYFSGAPPGASGSSGTGR